MNDHEFRMTPAQFNLAIEQAENRGYERGVTNGYDEAVHDVKCGETDPQTYVRKAK